MKKHSFSGKFIVFDGLDGSGLSTQANLLADFLDNEIKNKSLGFAGVYRTKEPTKSLIGGLINAQLDHDWKSSPECLQLLFSADRAYHLEKNIIPLLERGIIVICDRYAFSTMAFGNLGIRDLDWLKTLQEKFILPDLTFFLKVSAKECVERISKNRFSTTLFEKEKILEKVWGNYEKLSEMFSNIQVINGEQNIEDVSKEIKKITKEKIL